MLNLRYFLICLAPVPGMAIAQAANDTSVPRALFIQSMDREFGKMDADKDGKLTRKEVEDFQRLVAVAQSGARARALFGQLDSDHNGQLSFSEFAKTQSGPPRVNGMPLIAQLDSNKDGKVSQVEYRAGKLVRFDQADADKDGVVTAIEMRALSDIKKN